MEYFSILHFKKEPFSNSPEPGFFFEANNHLICLQKLELAVRLRRGLNVVVGDIGTGKTTLCRRLIQQLSFSPKDSQEIETHLLLDPSFDSISGFLQELSSMIGIKDLDGQENEWQLKEKIKNYLFNKGVDENKIIVFIIDEGQKIPENCVEILRELLNYETNDFKLLQIIIFAQPEFKKVLENHVNLADRINYLYYLNNLNFLQMRDMINYRLSVARNFEKKPDVFTFWGMAAIYLATCGYPRKVVSLCHQILLMMIIRGKNKADFLLIRKCINDMYYPLFPGIRRIALGTLLVISISAFVIQLISSQVIPISTITPAFRIAQANVPVNMAHNTNVPDLLGTLTMKEGMTLFSTINNIYGDTSLEIIEKINKANPHINNINKIQAGQKIHFPSIPAGIGTIKVDNYIVFLEKGNDITNMYNLFADYTHNKPLPPLLFFPFWNSREGMTFAIILDKKFTDPQAAREVINTLPADVAVKAQIISAWYDKSNFFNRRVLKN